MIYTRQSRSLDSKKSKGENKHHPKNPTYFWILANRLDARIAHNWNSPSSMCWITAFCQGLFLKKTKHHDKFQHAFYPVPCTLSSLNSCSEVDNVQREAWSSAKRIYMLKRWAPTQKCKEWIYNKSYENLTHVYNISSKVSFFLQKSPTTDTNDFLSFKEGKPNGQPLHPLLSS